MLLSVLQLALQRKEMLIQLNYLLILGLTVTGKTVSLVFEGFGLDL